MDSRKVGKLGEFVRKIRTEKGLSIDDVRINSGGSISGSYVNKIENENVQPTTPKLLALAKGLGVPPETIFSLMRGDAADPEKLSSERFTEIIRGYANLSEQEMRNIEPIIAALETAIKQSASNQQVNIPVRTVDELKKMREKNKKTSE